MNFLKDIDTIILSITDECNLRCKYCFVKKQPNYITFDICKQIIDLIQDNNKEQFNIDFFGGEPMLMYEDIIVPIILYTETIKTKIKFNITTNGTLLNEERLKFLKDHNVSLLLSMDGNQTTQDYNRPTLDNKSSFDILLPLLPIIQQYYPDITIRGTIYPDTCQNLYEDLNFFVQHNFYNFFFCPDEFSKWTEEKIQLLKDELRKITIYYISQFKNCQVPINFTPYTKKFSLLYQLYNNENNLQRTEKQCGLGYQIIAINYNGDLFACQELTSYPIDNNPYYLGNLETGINQLNYSNLINKFLQGSFIAETEKKINCNTCSYKPACQMNLCHANCFLKNNNFNTQPYIRCIWNQYIFEECKTIFLIESIKENQFFNKYFLDILQSQ